MYFLYLSRLSCAMEGMESVMYPEETLFLVGIFSGIGGFMMGVVIVTIRQYLTMWDKEP